MTWRASFKRAVTEPTGTPFLPSTSSEGADASTRRLALDIENNFESASLSCVTLLMRAVLAWQAAIFGSTSTNSLTVDATDARAA